MEKEWDENTCIKWTFFPKRNFSKKLRFSSIPSIPLFYNTIKEMGHRLIFCSGWDVWVPQNGFSSFHCKCNVTLVCWKKEMKDPKKNKSSDNITAICVKKWLLWHLAILYLVYCFSLKKHIQILGKNMLILPCLQPGFCSKGSSQSFWALGFNLYPGVKEVETEIEMCQDTLSGVLGQRAWR